jgi:hypothetical protein
MSSLLSYFKCEHVTYFDFALLNFLTNHYIDGLEVHVRFMSSSVRYRRYYRCLTGNAIGILCSNPFGLRLSLFEGVFRFELHWRYSRSD